MQLQSYINQSLGKDANTHMFRDRLIWFVDKLVKNNKGAVPFIFDRNEGDLLIKNETNWFEFEWNVDDDQM